MDATKSSNAFLQQARIRKLFPFYVGWEWPRVFLSHFKSKILFNCCQQLESYNINQTRGTMCFIKKQGTGNRPTYERCGNNCECSTVLQSHNNATLPYYNVPFIWNNQILQNACALNRLSGQLQSISALVSSNNQLIRASFEKLQKNQHQLLRLDGQIDELLSLGVQETISEEQEVQKYIQDNISFYANSSVVHKLFGRKSYRFKIKSLADLPKIIYKERNLHIPLQLATNQGKLVKNGNLMHLCIAVCDQQGKWVVDQNDQFFIQGKVEIDLYRGECQFKKVYPKDISRHFPGGKINIIVYPKPSILVTSQPLAKGQYIVSCDQIEPLIFSNILIKAKRKHRN